MPPKLMSMTTRKEYLASIYKRYRFSSKKEKAAMLDEFCLSTGYQRKYATRLLNAPLHLEPPVYQGKRETYTNEDIYYVKKIWDVLDYPCGQRLAPMLPEMMSVLERCGELTVPDKVAVRLKKISAPTIDRRLAPFKRAVTRAIHGTTKPGSLLKKQIPIVLSRWDEKRPGYTELDLVAHCGNSASGDFVSTLNTTDLATGWSEEEAILGKAQKRVIVAINQIDKRLPFKLLGIDPDNGSEFINWQLYTYCLAKKIEFTRGRPGKKNDNAHIEQKNWTHVRKIVGYQRLETQAQVDLLNRLYRGPVRLYMNFFQPVMKLAKKERVGGRLKRQNDVPKTPYHRVLEHPAISPATKKQLASLYQTLNPISLKREIEQGIAVLHKTITPKKNQQTKVTFSMIKRMPAKLHF
jgi:hypothetical protein